MQKDASARESSELTEKFILLQILRIIFGMHMKRQFEELAIQIESTISKRIVKKAMNLDPDIKRRIP